MGNDPFVDFITQGAILRLILTTCFFGLLWLGTVVLVGRRAAERKRRRREGLPPLPSIFTQTWNVIQNLTTPQGWQAITQSFSARTGGGNKDSPTIDTSGLPLPDLDLLTTDLPEPDFDELTGELEAAPIASPVNPVFDASSAPEASVPEEIRMTDQSLYPDSDSGTPLADFVGDEPRRSASDVYVPGSGELPTDAVEVMRVWRDLSDGSLIIQMNGKLFQTVAEMQNRGLAKRFITLVKDLAQLARIGAQAAGLPPPGFEATSSVISEQGAWASQKALPKAAPPAAPIGKDLPPILDSISAAGLEPSGSLGIAAQIEELLQYRLMQTPIFQHRSIHVRPNPDGTLRIEVDNRTYQHVDDVVDVDVREFIQTVIREWEARQ
jgi:hypothetical protein